MLWSVMHTSVKLFDSSAVVVHLMEILRTLSRQVKDGSCSSWFPKKINNWSEAKMMRAQDENLPSLALSCTLLLAVWEVHHPSRLDSRDSTPSHQGNTSAAYQILFCFHSSLHFTLPTSEKWIFHMAVSQNWAQEKLLKTFDHEGLICV